MMVIPQRMGADAGPRTLAVAWAGALSLTVTVRGGTAITRGQVPLAGYVLMLIVAFAVLYAAARWAGSRGMLALWGVAVLFWCMGLVNAFSAGRGIVLYAARHLPEPFAVWNIFAVPLAVATGVWLKAGGPWRPSARTLAAIGSWIALAVLSACLVRFAPDVGPNPRDRAAVFWPMAIMLPVLPYLVSGWLIHNLRRAEQRQ
jgi:hypothetical protein